MKTIEHAVVLEHIAETVRRVRKHSGLSQQGLAELAGIGKTVVFDIEKAKPTIQLNSLLKILEALNIEMMLSPPFEIREQSK